MRRFHHLFALAIVFLSPIVPSADSAPRNAVPMATEDRLQLPVWWPTKGTASRDEFVGPAACAPCHSSKFQTQAKTPMANALAHATDSETLRSHNRMTFAAAPYTYQIVRRDNGSVFSVTDGAEAISVPIGWAFGLGESGQTYVFEREGTFYESRVSYYRALDGLDFTPTPSRTPSSSLEGALGRKMLYAGETQRCFGCHTTASTTKSGFDPNRLIPGVTCEACHGPGAKHVAAMKSNKMGLGLKSILDPGQLDPVDLADFCGACHRTFVDVTLTRTFGIQNLRFQPYRMERSQCWIKSKGGITCLACHNPHQPRMRDDASYDEKCLSCHRTEAGHSVKVCTVSVNNCVSCHMPKYDMPGMHFKFTDHFIRIVRKDEPYSD